MAINSIQQAINLCVDSLNTLKEDKSPHAEAVATFIKSLFEQPYQGRGLGIGDFGYKDYRASWDDQAIYYKDQKAIKPTSLDWKSAFLLLVDAANLDEDEILHCAMSIESPIIFNHVLKHIITNCVVNNAIEKALDYIPNFRQTTIFAKENNRDQGYLIILKYFALKGDNSGFFTYFKQALPAKNRAEVAECKSWLVYYYSEKNTLDAAIALCKHKNLGHKFYHDALLPFADKGHYQQLKQLFKEQPELQQPELCTAIKIMVTAYKNAKQQCIKTDDDFEQLFSQCLQIKRSLRFGDIKLQDALLLDLGIACGTNKARMMKCRRAIKDNRVKKELVIN